MEYCIFIAGPKAEDVLEDWVLLDALIAYLYSIQMNINLRSFPTVAE